MIALPAYAKDGTSVTYIPESRTYVVYTNSSSAYTGDVETHPPSLVAVPQEVNTSDGKILDEFADKTEEPELEEETCPQDFPWQTVATHQRRERHEGEFRPIPRLARPPPEAQFCFLFVRSRGKGGKDVDVFAKASRGSRKAMSEIDASACGASGELHGPECTSAAVDETQQLPAPLAIWSKDSEGPFVYVRLTPGELHDRLTIAEIKAKRCSKEEDRDRAQREYEELVVAENSGGAFVPKKDDFLTVISLVNVLSQTNLSLWRAEEQLRRHEQSQTFDQDFIDLARQVYMLNDRRSRLKSRINALYGSRTEIKDLPDYRKENPHGQAAEA